MSGIRQLYKDSITVYRGTATQQTDGSYTRSWAAVGSAILGFMNDKAGRELAVDGGEKVRTSGRLFLPLGTDIKENDQVYYNSRYYEVLNVTTPGASTSLKEDYLAIDVVWVGTK